jgi:hypothetical protein
MTNPATETRKAMKTLQQPIKWTSRSGSRLPNSPFITAPIKGRQGMSQRLLLIISGSVNPFISFHEIQVPSAQVHHLNSKSEALNPKQIQNYNFPMLKTGTKAKTLLFLVLII